MTGSIPIVMQHMGRAVRTPVFPRILLRSHIISPSSSQPGSRGPTCVSQDASVPKRSKLDGTGARRRRFAHLACNNGQVRRDVDERLRDETRLISLNHRVARNLISHVAHLDLSAQGRSENVRLRAARPRAGGRTMTSTLSMLGLTPSTPPMFTPRTRTGVPI